MNPQDLTTEQLEYAIKQAHSRGMTSTVEELAGVLKARKTETANYDKPAVDPETAWDYAPLAGEIGLGIVGSIIGAAATGAAVGSVVPVFGTAAGFIGGLGMGAAGAFGGSLLGSAAEQTAEGRAVDMEANMQRATQAAKDDALWSVVGAGVGKAFKGIYKGVKGFFKPDLIDDVTGVSRVSDESAQIMQDLQAKLEGGFGTQLLPSQLGPASSKSAQFAEKYVSSSALSDFTEQTILKQDKYITEQVLGLSQSLKGLDDVATGKALVDLLKTTEKGMKETVRPLYAEIDELGGLAFKTTGLKQLAEKESSGYLMSTPERSLLKFVQDMPETIDPKTITKMLAELKKVPTTTRGSALKNKIVGVLENQLKSDKLVKTDTLKAASNKILDTLIGEEGQSLVSGSLRKIATNIQNMRSSMSFTEAMDHLSDLKATRRELESLNPSDKALAAVSQMSKLLDNAMETAAKNIDPALRPKFDAVNTTYRQGLETLYSDNMRKVVSLNKTKPEAIAETLTSIGSVTPLRDLKAALDLAKTYKVSTDVGDVPLIEAIQKNYIERLFKGNDIGSVERFAKQLENPRFERTFNEVLDGTSAGKKALLLVKEAKILNGNLIAKEGSSSLTVRQREYSAMLSLGLLDKAIYSIIPTVFKGSMDPAYINKWLGDVKKINAQIAKGQDVDLGVVNRLISRVSPSATIGRTAAGLGREEQFTSY